MKIKMGVSQITNTGAMAAGSSQFAVLTTVNGSTNAAMSTITFGALAVQTPAERAASIASAINTTATKSADGYRPVAAVVDDLLIVAWVVPDTAADSMGFNTGNLATPADTKPSGFVVRALDDAYAGPAMPVGAKTAAEFRSGLIAAFATGGILGLSSTTAR